MRIVLALTLALAIAGSAQAQTQLFYLHHSDLPVAIPGGTTTSFLDGTHPTAPLATAEQSMLAPGASAVLPTFTTPPFSADTTLLPVASVTVLFSANQKLRACGTIAASLSKLDAAGVPTEIGAASVSGFTILQGKSEGTVATGGQRIEFPLTNTSITPGQGIALTTLFTNDCSASRRLFFSYDGSSAAARVRFQCCFTTSAKCAEAKIKAVGKEASCFLGAHSRAAARGVAADPLTYAKCSSKFTIDFQRAEDRGGCPTIGDAAPLEAATYAFDTDVSTALTPAPTVGNKCQAGKITAAAKEAKCLLDLEAKAAKTGELLDPDPIRVAKCREKYALLFAKLEGKGPCDTTGDAATIEAKIDAFVSAVASGLACPCP